MSHEKVKKHIESNDDWGKSTFQTSDLSAAVTHFNFVAYENVSNAGDKVGGKELPPTNHWTLFLALNTNTSVRVEVVPNEPGQPGMVVLESKDYLVTFKAVKTVEINPLQDITVADVLDLIIQNK